MISQIIIAFSSLIGRAISNSNEKEVKKYDKNIRISQYIVLFSMIFFVPVAIPLIAVLMLNVYDENLKMFEVISKGGILFFNSQIALLLLLLYEILEGRKFQFKKLIIYDVITVSTYLVLFLLSKFL